MSTYYSPKVVTDGMVLCLDAANNKSYVGSGTSWVDISSSGPTGTLVNSPTFTSSFGGNFVFNGSTQYASVSNVYNFATSNQFSAFVWAKSTPSTWNENGFLVSRRDQFIFHPSAGNRDINYYLNTNAGWQALSYAPSDITVFGMYAMTYYGGNFRIFFNGALVSSATNFGTTLTSDTGVIEIGKDDTLARYMNGSVASVYLYNRMLSDAEVLQNYTATKARFNL